jgi:hypothetical protein
MYASDNPFLQDLMHLARRTGGPGRRRGRSAVVPLLGGLRGVNDLARMIGAAFGTKAAVIVTGEVGFAATLEHPPPAATAGPAL